MKIVFVTLTMNKGGAERVIANLCNDYLSMENEITIITCTKDKPQYEMKENIDVLSLDESIKQKEESKVNRLIRRRKKLKRLINELNPDVVISFLPEPCFITLSIKKYINCPVIISVRNDPKIEYKFLPYKILMKLLYPKTDGIVYQTEDAKEYFNFSKNLKENGVIIANPINKNFIGKEYLGKRKKEIVAVGRLFEQKNYPLLIKSFYDIKDDIKDYNLKIYGEGVLRENLEDLIKSLQIEDRVQLCGQKDNIIEYIKYASVFVMSSDFEGMPNSLMEAMALGLPVISTDCPCGGPKTLINNNQNGILVPVNDRKQLSEQILRLINDKELSNKLSNNAIKIVDNFSPDIIYDKWGKYIYKITKDYKKGEKNDRIG